MEAQPHISSRINALEKELALKNRELEIEAALERVRTVAMSMKEPADMLEVCKTISHQLDLLHVKEIRNVQTAIFYENKSTYMNYEYYTKHDKTIVTETSYTNHEIPRAFANQMLKGNGQVFITHIKGEEVNDWIAYQKTTNVFIDDYLYTASSLNYYWHSLGAVALGISTYEPLTEEEKNLFNRFLKVFELAYRRYLDIEQAKGQAREAQIELALERVRARTMAMQKSDELSETAYILFQQFKELGEYPLQITIGIFNEEKKVIELRITGLDGSGSKIDQAYNMNIDEPVLLHKIYAAWKEQRKSAVIELTGKDLRNWSDYKSKMGGVIKSASDISEDERRFVSVGFFSKGMISFSKRERISEETIKILERFARVFDQTYTRFLDLQKAEAQAREAQIEAALERVRTKAMTMQKSEDLSTAIATVFEELDKLDMGALRCGISIINKEKRTTKIWSTTKLEKLSTVQVTGDESMDIHPLLQGAYNAWLKPEDFSYVLQGEDLNKFYTALSATNFKLPNSESSKATTEQQQFLYVAHFPAGGLYAFRETRFTEEAKTIIKRFAQVFNLTYTRFNDLQIAEARAREARIEATMERVRARALGMQHPEELKDVVQVLRSEMGLLGVEELETCSIYIHDENMNKAECWYAIKDIRGAETKLVTDYFALDLNDTWVGRKMLQFYDSEEKQVSIMMTGVLCKEWIKYCEEKSIPLSRYYGDVIPDRAYHLYKFSHGTVGASTPGEISNESWNLLKRTASVFSLAYSRFRDLTQARIDLQNLKEEKKRAEEALSELKSTQAQLIQAEKMASLGELTAGIAHEIQNPLNFVNNFSEVSNELIREMVDEVDKGNIEEVTAIAQDVQQNLEKILHHGKRADAIVKGMLQHSRASTGQKEPTDINTLANEYLRLSYHGLRAKDKSFNATLQTDFDATIEKINIVPQDIGRVLLNLFNNAFYAVTEKKKRGDENYQPTVSVSTKKINDKVEIRIKDNGLGISEKILKKIYQPFFTTKPSGQGTGLGLSLSYDIITKAHGGEIKVETEEEKFAEFIVLLPA